MAVGIDANINLESVRALQGRRFERAALKAARAAASRGLRDMRAEASKRVRNRKRIKARRVREALVLSRPRGSKLDDLEFGVRVRGDPMYVSDYSYRATKRRGVSVQINKGKRSVIPDAFEATMASGHKGVFVRRGVDRLPIDELLASRPVDALLHEGEAQGVQRRGVESWESTFAHRMKVEMDKMSGGGE